MGQEDKQQMNLVITDGSKQVVFNAHVSFSVEEKEESPEIHVSDAIYAAVLQKLKEQPAASLKAGDYRLSLTVAISDMTDTKEKEEPVEIKEAPKGAFTK